MICSNLAHPVTVDFIDWMISEDAEGKSCREHLLMADVVSPHLVSSSSRWRRLPPEYGSTSEEEFGSNRNTNPKHGGRAHLRPHHPVLHRGSASRLTSAGSNPTSTTAGGAGSGLVSSPGGVVMKHRMREQDEYIRDWTAHSEEIARYDQLHCRSVL